MLRDHFFIAAVVAAVISVPATGIAQENTSTTENVTTINILNPGISRELKIGNRQTFKFSAMMNLMVSILISDTFDETNFYADPAMEAGFRHYFNLAKRQNAGKRIEKNSGNYVSGYAQLIYSKMPVDIDLYKENKRRPLTVLGACWGMQRNYKGHFSLDLNLGVQYRFAKSTYPDFNNSVTKKVQGEFLPAGGLTLGIWLN